MAALAAAAACIAVIWHRIVFLGETWVLRDTLTLTLPSREAVASAMRAGRLAEWWDATGSGAVLAANPIHAALSPIAWLLFPIPRVGPDLYVLLHLTIGAVGLGLWAVRLGADTRGAALAAATFTASGYVASTVPNGMAPVVAAMPWGAWAADRLASARDRDARVRAALVLALAWAFQLLPGEPGQAIATGWLMTAVLLARLGVRRWRILGWAAASVAAAVALDAAVLLPAVEQLRISLRGAGLHLAVGGMWSMNPLRLVEILWPGALGPPLDPTRTLQPFLRTATPGTESFGPVWSMSVHLGAAALVLALLGSAGRSRRVLLLASAGFLVLALGTYTPFYAAYRTVFLPEQAMRYPEKHVAGAIAIWCALAGVGLTRMLRAGAGPPFARRLAVAAATVASLALAIFLGSASLGAEVAANEPGLDGAGAFRAIATGGGILAASLAALSGAAALAVRARVVAAAALATVGVLGPLAWDAAWFVRSASRERVFARPPVVDMIRTADPDARFGPAGLRVYRGWEPVGVSPDWGEMFAAYQTETIAGNVAARFGLGAIPGLDSSTTANAERFWAAMNRLDRITYMTLLGVRWALVWVAPGDSPPRPPAASLGQGWHLLHVPEARPRAFVAPRWTTARPGDAVIDDFARTESTVDLGRVAVEGVPPSPAAHEGEPLSPCLVEAPAAEEVELRCATRLGGFAVLLDELAPGWTATVDGAPAEIRRIDGFFRGVYLGPGPHRVAFRYSTPGLRHGIAVSMVAWASFAVAAAWMSRRRSLSCSEAMHPT
ncbi:MAG TPA: YfhO family protein [Anaeromyxobacter sp.]|nr:YfhO family protein [Anaeromyxobacter sp.]